MTVRCSKSAFVPFRTCGRKLALRVDRPGCLLSLSGIAKTCIWNWCSRPHIPAFTALSQKRVPRFDITKLPLFFCPYLLSDVFFPQFFNGHIGQWKEPNAGNSRIPFNKGGQIRRDDVDLRVKKMLAIKIFGTIALSANEDESAIKSI